MIAPVVGPLEWEPAVGELVAIEAEWPVLAAELAVVEAECAFLVRRDVLTRRRLRRSVAAMTRAYVQFHGTGDAVPAPLVDQREILECEGARSNG